MMLLLLAGTGEARRIASMLEAEGIAAVASLSGATRSPSVLAITTRTGGFGGDAGFEEYLIEQGITAVLDATHPFAAAISQRTARLTRLRGLPYLQVLRAPWVAQPDDDWSMIASAEQAADLIPTGATVFLATGRQTLTGFANMNGRRMICRQIDPPDGPFPYANGEYLLGRPPFSVADEVALFLRLGIDWLVVKNAGGERPRTKLEAARQLGIKVAMIERPGQPDADKVQTPEQALDWVRGLG